MLALVTIWWLCFLTAVGLCIGSFLNVVIYRLPMGLAVNKPRWSFCPNCHNRIAWYDNLPLISYLRLKGRCHNCWQPISPQYPLVELTTAMIVIGLLDDFFIHQGRDGFLHGVDLNCRLWSDWPIFAAHVILFSGLLAMSAIDLQYYWVDIRFTHFVAACGIVLHTVWTPPHSSQWLRPFDATAIACMAAMVGFAVVWCFLMLHAHRRDSGQDKPGTDRETEPERHSFGAPVHADPDAVEQGRRVKTVGLAIGVFLFVWMAVTVSSLEGGWTVPYVIRAGLPLVFFFFVILRAAAVVRESDTHIAEEIQSQAPTIRWHTMGELAMLTPGIILGAGALWLHVQDGQIARSLVAAIHWTPFDTAWQPIWGFGTAISGYVIAAGMGWSIRIVANLAFGKEAFATGDIHMMAAAGAVAGWPIVLIGFMITCLLALFAWVLLLPVKKSRVIPLGPWLTMGFFIATLFYRQLVATAVIHRFVAAADLLFFDNSQL